MFLKGKTVGGQLHQTQTRDEIAGLRKEAGAWLKERREAQGLSQRDLAARVGIEYYTFISQIEAGRGRVPAERFEAYANALKVDPREFTQTMLRYNEPVIFNLLFGATAAEVTPKPASSIADLEQRLALLESQLRRD